ncbi:response regulator transcription factor [Egicoccus sp. AB-alg6-2]|uniref:response regulator transcription factor n=1 Tax=Egicoccus sp. AB-alg6-2 TaxID=3242692 RepID=UPI00359EBA25
MAASPRILLVEDDTTLRESIAVALRGEGYEVEAAADGTDGAAQIDAFRPDLAILDVRLPDGPDGLDLARLVRARGDIPIIFVTALGELDDRLAGFEAGGDDYLTKPFSTAELLVRIQALLRRAGRLESRAWQVDDLVVDEAARTAIRDGNPLELTRTEFDLLVTLGRNIGTVVSKSRLLALVWGFESYDENLVEVHISALRRKLEAEGSRLIHTVRGVGYVLRG